MNTGWNETDLILEAYHASFNNRNIVYKRANINEQGTKFSIRSAVYLALVVVKIVVSRFVQPLSARPTIFISWSPLHTKLAERIGQRPNLVEIRNTISRDQTALYKNVHLCGALSIARKIFSHNGDRHKTGYDNIFFCIAFVLEFRMLADITVQAQHILMAGQLDRYAIMLSILARTRKQYFSFVQHGVNNVFKGLYRLHADEIYYLFEISIPFFSAFVLEAEKKKFLPIPQVKPNFKPDPRYKNAIAFASQMQEADLEILDIMIQYYTHGDVLIYPHPTEKNLNSYRKYEKLGNVYITRDRVSNISHVISTGSTLGLEYDLIGVIPVFINLHKLESEVFYSEKFVQFDDIASFREWFVQNIAKK